MTNRGNADDAAPDMDRQEGESPSGPDPRFGHTHPSVLPEADVLEQEMPVVETDEIPTGVDEDRVEPIDETDRIDEETQP